MTAELTPLSPGVVRLTWSMSLQELGVGPCAEEVRRALDQAFTDGIHRVEAHVDPDDLIAHRVATFGGLMREGIARGVDGGADRVVYARLTDDTPVEEPMGFRLLLNSFLPRKRAISQLLIRDEEGRVLLCQLTYKSDWDLPGGVVEVGESPQLAVSREIEEELAVQLPAGRLILTDWMPPWGGWDDAVCLVFDGGQHPPSMAEQIVPDRREIRSARFCTVEEARELCADFTTRRIEAALANLDGGGSAYTESGRG